MPLPGGVTTIVVTSTYEDMQGNPQSGTVTFTPSTGPFNDPTVSVIFEPVTITATVSDEGTISETLPCTNNSGFEPSSWVWNVTERITGSAVRAYSVSLPSTLGGTADLSDLAQSAPVVQFANFLQLSAGSASPLTGSLYLDGSPPIVLPSGTTGYVLGSDSSGNMTLQPPADPAVNAVDWVNAAKAPYGASTSGSASANTTAIQAALSAVHTAGGGVCYLPAGTYAATNLTVPSNTTLLGDGPGATILSVASGTTGAVISLATPASTRKTCVRDLMIEGNNVSVTGISLDNTGLSPSTPGQHRLYNVTVQDCGVDSFYYGSALVETFSAFLTSYNAGRYGYNVTTGATDSRWVSCTTGPSGSHGWVCTGSNDHYDLCKAYYAGWNGSAFSTGHGWYVLGTSAYPTMGSSWTGCEAQDCAQQGWNFNPNGGSLNNLSMMACVIDSCNAAAGTGGAGAAVVTDYVVYSTIAGCTAWNRSGGAGTMTYGISVAGVQTGLVMTGNTWNCSTGPFYYNSGYGYLLAEQYIFDLTGVSQYVKVPALVQAPASPQALTSNAAITVNTAYSLIPLTATGAVTGITMPTAGLQSGQTVTLLNQSAFSITFAAAGTSAVADGVSDVIAALTAVAYIWDGNTSLWYPLR